MKLTAEAFAGQDAPVTVSILPLKDLGRSTVTVSALSGPRAAIPAGRDRRRICLLPSQPRDGGWRCFTPSRRGSSFRETPSTCRNPCADVLVDRPRAGNRQPRRLHRPGDLSRRQKGAPLADSAAVHRPREPLDAADIPVGPFGGGIGIPWVRGRSAPPSPPARK